MGGVGQPVMMQQPGQQQVMMQPGQQPMMMQPGQQQMMQPGQQQMMMQPGQQPMMMQPGQQTMMQQPYQQQPQTVIIKYETNPAFDYPPGIAFMSNMECMLPQDSNFQCEIPDCNRQAGYKCYWIGGCKRGCGKTVCMDHGRMM